MKFVKRILVMVMAIFMTFTFTACSIFDIFALLLSGFMGEEYGDLSFEYVLTEDDLTEFEELVKEFEELGMEGTNVLSLNFVSLEMMDKFDYLEAQYYAAYVGYCLDQTDEMAIANLAEAEEVMAAARTMYLNSLKKLAQESKIKDELFAGWSKEDLASLFADTEKVSALSLENSELTREFYALDSTDLLWSSKVGEIYENFVSNNQAISLEYGFNNYYDYAADGYGRTYSKTERDNFRSYVAKYVVPLFEQALNETQTLYASLTQAQQFEYTLVYTENDYLYDYVDSYSGSLHEKMNAMFTRPNAIVWGKNENAYKGAFVNYVSYYGQPFAYFGPGYQDNLTIVHELGHYASLYYFDMGGLAYDLAETHSQGNEWMMISYLQDKIDPQVARMLALDSLANGLASVLLSTVVDHFEELVYTASTPVKASDYKSLMDSVCNQYAGLTDVLKKAGSYSPFQYAQLVTIGSPVYYMNYATSQLASMGLYAIAQADGYTVAQTAYTKLQEGVDVDADFLTAVNEAGLLNPFMESTYVKIRDAFTVA